VDEQREQNGVPEKENWGVIPHKVPDPILSVELYGKSAGIPETIIMDHKTREIFILNK
jgi:hypothetical protein